MPSSIASKGGESVASEPPDLERGDKAISKDVKPPVNETEDQSSTGYAVNKIWTIYNHKSESHDSALVSRLNSSMDSILVFAGLFSAVVTAFIIESYKMLNPDSGDITVFYLTQLTREVMKLSTTTDIPPPPTAIETPHAVAVNVLWVLSLIASLACALGATLIQTWTSRYLRVVSRSPDAVSRARARAWYFDGLKKSQMEAFAAGVPMILHLALWLFLAGLVVFLFPVNRKVANAALGAAAACGVIYLTFAFMDLFVGNSPYKTPFSVCLSVIILGFAGSIFFGFALGVAALLLGLILITLVLALPALPITYFAVGPKKVASEWKDLWSSESPAGLPDAEKWDNYRKGGSSHVYNRLVGAPSGKPKQDVKALKWLLQQTSTVAELEDFVEGIESFIESSKVKRQDAKVILELGGNVVETLNTGLGLCVGQLLESCTESHRGSEGLPPDHRRSRATSAARAMISLFAWTKSKERVEPIAVAEGTPGIVKEILEEGQLPSVRWIEWVDITLWEKIITLRHDEDPVIALHASYLSSLILHRALVDIAFRLQSREVQIVAPVTWNIRDLLSALQHVAEERLELYELAVAILVIPQLDERAEGITAVPDLPPGYSADPKYRKKHKSRPLLVTMSEDASVSENGVVQETESTGEVSHETFRNEAMLLALTTLLNQIPAGSSIPQSDVLSRIISAIVKDGGTAAGTSPPLQRDFIAAIQRHRTAYDAAQSDPLTKSKDRARVTGRSIFHIKDAIDELVVVLGTVDAETCRDEAQAIVSHMKTARPLVKSAKFGNQKKLQQIARAALARSRQDTLSESLPVLEKEKLLGEMGASGVQGSRKSGESRRVDP